MGPNVNDVLLIVDVQRGFINQWTRHIPEIVEGLQETYRHVVATRFINPPGSPYRRLIGWSRMAPESAETDLVFRPRADAVLIEKQIYNCIDRTFRRRLDTWGAREVHLAGIATDNCVLTCAVGLFEAGYRPVVLADACASHGGGDCHNAGLMLLRRLIGEKQVVSI